MTTKHTEEDVIVIMKDALLKPKQVLAIWINKERKSFFGFFERTRYYLHVQYIAEDEQRHTWNGEHKDQLSAKEDMKSVIEQLRSQTQEDQFVLKAIESAINKVGD